MGKPHEFTITVRGPEPLAEFIKREIAVALCNIGAFDVTAQGDFRNDDGTSQDPKRMKALADLAKQGVAIPIWGYRRLRRRGRAALHPRPAGAAAGFEPYEAPRVWRMGRRAQCAAIGIPMLWRYWIPFVGWALLRRKTRATVKARA